MIHIRPGWAMLVMIGAALAIARHEIDSSINSTITKGCFFSVSMSDMDTPPFLFVFLLAYSIL
jgi:hypothetical protein